MTSFKLIQGDCIEVMRAAKSESVHAIVTDPPYGIEFMGATWDSPQRMVGESTGVSGGFNNIPAGELRPDMSKCNPQLFQQWCEAWGREALRVLKPGGHIFSFGATRMYHRMVAGLEDAGFEIRDMIGWIYGEGFPKGKSLPLLIDKAAGHENRGRAIPTASSFQASDTDQENRLTSNPVGSYEGITDEAQHWEGWKTPCLKPAIEPIVVARKPMRITGKRPGTTKKANYVQNVAEHGVGCFNIDAARIGDDVMVNPPGMKGWNDYRHDGEYQETDEVAPTVNKGRYPANLIFDEDAATALDEQTSRGESRFFKIIKDQSCDHASSADANLLQQRKLQDSAPSAAVISESRGIGKATGSVSMSETQRSSSNECVNDTQMIQSSGSGASLDPQPDAPIQIPNLARSAEQAEPTDTTKTMTSQPKLDGCVESAIFKNMPPSLDRGDTDCEINNRTLYVAKAKGKDRPDHPTAKPVELMEHLIALAVPPGGQVLDPFMGSGTTGVAALRRSCRFIGIEMDPKYVAIAQQRCEREVSE